MKRKRSFSKLCLLLWCLFLFFSITIPVSAMAVTEDIGIDNEVDEENQDRFTYGSPWMEHADQSIYSNQIDASEEDQEIEPDKPGIVEKRLSELIRNAASSLIALLEDNLGASLDKIIYGRVGSGKPNSVNIYSFELRSGNPYGVTASVCYSVIRSIAFVSIGIVFVFILAKASWTGHTAQSREQIKSSIYNVGMRFAMLTLMPYIFDVGLYIRDVVLYGIKEVTGLMITNGATLSLSRAFLINAEQSGRFVDALMYLGTVLLTMYFAIIYVAVAIDLLICFVVFPIMCVMQTPKRDLLGNWIMNVVSDMLTPVLDAVLLLVPLLTSLMLADVVKGIAIIQMIMCMLLIPSRNRIKALLGIQSNERGGILGAMAMFSIGRSMAGRIKGAFGRIGDIRSDLEKSRMHKDMAGVDEQEQDSFLNGYSGREKNQEFSDKPLGNEDSESAYQKNADDSVLAGNPDENNDVREGLEPMEDGLDGSEDTLYRQGSLDGEMENYGGEDSGFADPDISEEIAPEGDVGEGIHGETDDILDVPMSRNEALRHLDQAMEHKQDTIDALKSRKAYYQNAEKQKARQMLDYERGTDEYRTLERQRADAAVRVAQTGQKIAGQMRDMNQLRNEAKMIRGTLSGPISTRFDDARAEILSKRANINNFEQPEFQSALSNAQMQKLYKQRAMVNLAKGAGAATGAVSGAVFLSGVSMFMQPSTVAMAGVAGIAGGSAVGSAVGNIGIAGIQLAGRAVNAGRKLYDLAGQRQAAASGVDFETVYEQSPSVSESSISAVASVPIETPDERQQRIVNRVQVTESAFISENNEVSNVPSLNGKVIREMFMADVERDSTEALNCVISPAGGVKSSAAIRALKNANIETEKYITAIRETEEVNLTPKQEIEKRIELQTRFLTDEVMKKLGNQPEYEKGTERYDAARKQICEKVQVIIEKQNKDIF